MDSLGEQTDELSKILGTILEPMVQMCTLSASGLNPNRMAVYMLNCIYRIRTILSVYDNTEQWTESLASQSATYIDTLVEEQARSLLIKSGLRTLITLMQTWEVEDAAVRAPLSQTAGLDPQSVHDHFYPIVIAVIQSSYAPFHFYCAVLATFFSSSSTHIDVTPDECRHACNRSHLQVRDAMGAFDRWLSLAEFNLAVCYFSFSFPFSCPARTRATFH